MSFSLNEFLFGNLDVEYCFYFYILSVIQFSVGMFMVLSLLFMLTLGSKKVNSLMVMPVLMGGLAYFVLYFQSRLLHSICLKSSKESMCNSTIPNSKLKESYSN